MNAGYPHNTCDAELTKERATATRLTREFNESKYEAVDQRKLIMKELLNPKSSEAVFFEPNSNFRCEFGYNITIGEGSYINFNCCILDCAPVKIGKNALLAPNVHIYANAATYPNCGKQREEFGLSRPVTIGDNVWIGGRSVICPGVTIGDYVTVGAGSVVTEDVPSHVVVAGNPAKIIRYLPEYEHK